MQSLICQVSRPRMRPGRLTDRRALVWIHLRITSQGEEVVWASKTMTCVLLLVPNPSDALFLWKALDTLKLLLSDVTLASEARFMVRACHWSPLTPRQALPALVFFTRTLELFCLSVFMFLVSKASFLQLQSRVIHSLTLRAKRLFPYCLCTDVRPELTWWSLGCALEYWWLQLGGKKGSWAWLCKSFLNKILCVCVCVYGGVGWEE